MLIYRTWLSFHHHKLPPCLATVVRRIPVISLRRLSDLLNDFAERIAIVLLAIITILTFIGVLSRYVFGTPIIWLYETTLVLFSWATFFGVSIAFKREEHIHLDIIMHHISDRGAKILRVVIKAILFIFLGIIIIDGISIIKDTMTQSYNTIPVPYSWFYAAFPVCAVISCIHLASQAADAFVQDTLGTEARRVD